MTNTQRYLSQLRETYKKGTVLEIEQRFDPRPISAGTRCKVLYVDSLCQLRCVLADGKQIVLNPEMDKFHVVSTPR